MVAKGFGSLPSPIDNYRAGPNYPNLFKTVEEGGKFFSISFNTGELLRLVETEKQKFGPKYYEALTRANRRAATIVQRGMAQSVKDQIGEHSSYGARPQRAGNRLVKSLMNEQNAVVHSNNFMVGIETWLSKSPAAAYWRTIEEGMAGYDTRALFFTPGKGGFASPGVGGPHMRMMQFNKMSQVAKVRGAAIHVSPIEPFHYSEGGWEAFHDFDMGDLYIRTLRAAGFKNVSRDPAAGYFKPLGKK